jgi:hypothetical protein
MRLAETWVLDLDVWTPARYAYDLLMRPGPGRYGFHWHDGWYHTHCVDPAYPNRDHHYEGNAIDLFAAFERFTGLLGGGEPLSCAGLRPVREGNRAAPRQRPTPRPAPRRAASATDRGQHHRNRGQRHVDAASAAETR